MQKEEKRKKKVKESKQELQREWKKKIPTKALENEG